MNSIINKKATGSDKFEGLVTVGFLTGKVSPGRPTGWRVLRHDFLAFLVEGEVEFEWRGGGFNRFSGPSLIHAPAGEAHRYDPDVASSWRNYWMFIDAGECRRRYGEVLPPPGVSPVMADVVALERAWRELYDAAEVSGRKTGIMANFLLHALMAEIWRATAPDDESGGDVMVSEARRLMAARVNEPELDFSLLARELGMGYDNFRLRFKRLAGLSPKRCYLDMKINAAKALLAAPGCRVAEAADALGFRDPFYFSRLFKRKTGTSPREFSRSIYQGGLRPQPRGQRAEKK